MKVLVTGGHGFIASHTIDLLEQYGHVPVAFDRVATATRPIHLGDVRDYTAVMEAVGTCDGVIHLAGVLGTAETVNDPLPAVETNIVGSLNIFQACRRYDKPCVYITVGNYWMNNSYSITKTTAERFAWMFNKEHGTRISVVRALNAYGPYQKAKPVRKIMPNFILPALKGEEITVYGDGEQIMDMIYVRDVADILIRALTVDHGQYVFDPDRDADSPQKFEAGTGRRTSVKEIAEMVIEIVGSGSINYVPMRAGEPEHSVVLGDPETLKPLYNGDLPHLKRLEEGIVDTVKYYKGSNVV